jgi:hypothetical protein
MSASGDTCKQCVLHVEIKSVGTDNFLALNNKLNL